MSSLGNIKFQVIDWYSQNIEDDDSEEDIASDSDEDTKNKSKIDDSQFKIIVFGKDSKEQTYSVMINNFTPYFYVRVPENFSKTKLNILQNWVEEKM